MTMQRRRLRVLPLVTLLVAVGVGIGVAVSIRGTSDPITVGTFAAGLVAAAVIIIAYIRQESSAARIDELAKDIHRLAELTEGSMEEARALRAEPGVSFLAGEGPTDDLVWRRVVDHTPIDKEAILASHRTLALETLPPEPSGAPSAVSASLIATLAALQSSGLFPGITEADRDRFRERVDKSAEALDEWLDSYPRWRGTRPLILVAKFVFHNRGRVPATDVHVTLSFPAGFQCLEQGLEEMWPPPSPPKFEPPKSVFAGLGQLNAQAYLSPGLFAGIHAPGLSPPNLRGPWFETDPLRIEFAIGKLLHGVSIETDAPVFLHVPSDGRYEVHWEISAGNLSSPVHGSLLLEATTETTAGTVIANIDELIARNTLPFRSVDE
jgi:hypothetical protein